MRICEKTGDCPKRRARARRFINDLREARRTVPRFFHRSVSERPEMQQLCTSERARTRNAGVKTRTNSRSAAYNLSPKGPLRTN